MRYKAGEHAAELDYFLLAERELGMGNDSGVGGEFEVIFNFRRGGEGDLQKFCEIFVGCAARSLGDVRGDRECCSLKLARAFSSVARRINSAHQSVTRPLF